MSEAISKPDEKSALLGVLQGISQKLSILEEINMNLNELEHRFEGERSKKQKIRDKPSASVNVNIDDATRPRPRAHGKSAEDPVVIDGSNLVNELEDLRNRFETKTYMLSEKEWDDLKKKDWFLKRLGKPDNKMTEVDGNSVLSSFPDLVSGKGWGYYKPVRTCYGPHSFIIMDIILNCIGNSGSIESRKDFLGYWQDGIGKPNFVGAWKCDKMLDYPEGNDRRMDFTLIPYSSTPSMSLQATLERIQNIHPAYPPSHPPSHPTLHPTLHPPYRGLFAGEFNKFLGGIWTLPPDWRLDFDFQLHHFFLNESYRLPLAPVPENDYENFLIEKAKDIRKQLVKFQDIYFGLYTVTEIDSRGKFFTFDVTDVSAPSALEVEEWCLKISPTPFWTTANGFPITLDNSQGRRPLTCQMPWSRAITISGCAEVYKFHPWKSLVWAYDTERSGSLLWELHTACDLKANRLLPNATMFHMTWMTIESAPSSQLHKHWRRHKLQGGGEIETIGKVAGSIQYFLGPWTVDLEFGTILILAPKNYDLPYGDREGIRLNFSIVLATNICQLMDKAARDWEMIVEHIRGLLEKSKPKEFHTDDKDFTELLNVLWVIDKLGEILPMVRDSLEQWSWFRERNRILWPTGEVNPLEQWRPFNNVDSELLSTLAGKLQELEVARWKLEMREDEFRALQTLAFSLRDTLLLINKMNDSILSANIAILTYATIFFLPLTFCTSMWVVNDMFGTGGRGFAIITTVIPIATYAVVFNLIHPTTKKAILDGIKKAASWVRRPFRRLWRKLRHVDKRHAKFEAEREA